MRYLIWALIAVGMYLWLDYPDSWVRLIGAAAFSAGALAVTSAVWPARKAQR